jgi:hypothetical protein
VVPYFVLLIFTLFYFVLFYFILFCIVFFILRDFILFCFILFYFYSYISLSWITFVISRMISNMQFSQYSLENSDKVYPVFEFSLRVSIFFSLHL